jgi:hypothetical protein
MGGGDIEGAAWAAVAKKKKAMPAVAAASNDLDLDTRANHKR